MLVVVNGRFLPSARRFTLRFFFFLRYGGGRVERVTHVRIAPVVDDAAELLGFPPAVGRSDSSVAFYECSVNE